MEKYKPEIIWSDGSIEASDDYWKGAEFVAWLYNDSPVKETAVVNDRWGKGMNGICGDFYTYHDRYNPGKKLISLIFCWRNVHLVVEYAIIM